jgi:hypothetical protein
MDVFAHRRFSQGFRIFTQVAAWLLHRSRKNKGRAPLRGCVPYRYVFSSCTVNPFYLSLIFEKATSIGLKFGE